MLPAGTTWPSSVAASPSEFRTTELPRVRPAVALDRHRVAAAPPPVLQDLDDDAPAGTATRAPAFASVRWSLTAPPTARSPAKTAPPADRTPPRATSAPDASTLKTDWPLTTPSTRRAAPRANGVGGARAGASTSARCRRTARASPRPGGARAGGPRGRLDAAVLEREPAPERQGAAPDLEAAVDAEPAGAHVHAAAVDAEPARRDAHAAREHVEGAVAADRE